MGLFDFISGKNRKSASEESTIAEKAPVNQILSQPSADPFDAYKDVFKSDNFIIFPVKLSYFFSPYLSMLSSFS